MAGERLGSPPMPMPGALRVCGVLGGVRFAGDTVVRRSSVLDDDSEDPLNRGARVVRADDGADGPADAGRSAVGVIVHSAAASDSPTSAIRRGSEPRIGTCAAPPPPPPPPPAMPIPIPIPMPMLDKDVRCG